MERHTILRVVLFLSVFIFCYCTRILYQPVEYQADTSTYDSAFPYGDMADELEAAFDSVKRIMVASNYTTYLFNPDDRVTREKLLADGIQEYAVGQYTSPLNKAGTATIISSSSRSVAMLTCAHVVTLEDTLFHYIDVPEAEETEENYLRSISIKIDQVNLLFDQPGLGIFTVLAADSLNDIAVLGASISGENISPPKAISNTLGRSEELKMGSFVYILGYPRGHKMVHNGLVSNSNYDRRGGFITNALFNPGISGAPIFARRSADSEMEIVGLAKGSQGSRAYFLTPDLAGNTDYNPRFSYEGPVFVNDVQLINYGITFSASTVQIRSFLSDNRRELARRGYNLSSWADM